MTELSPAARAVLDAYYDNPNHASIAKALWAVADQVVPASPSASDAHLAVRHKLLAIGDELISKVTFYHYD